MKVADERFLAQDILIARDMVSLLFTTNETNQFNASSYWSDEPTARRILYPNLVEAKLNTILNSEYTCISALKLARAAYDFLTVQINKLFEDNEKNSQLSFKSFSKDVQQFLNQINFYVMNNPSARSNSIASTINLLKQLNNKSDFNPEQSLKTFSGYKEIMIQLLLKPFEIPVAEISNASVTGSDLIEKQSGIKTRLREMTSSANQDKQPVISPSLMRGPS
ncbi:TPA: hypothetical protein ACIZCU_000911 [Legionella pneumophila]|nr:hypothetical protein [Legionella pneumophila]